VTGVAAEAWPGDLIKEEHGAQPSSTPENAAAAPGAPGCCERSGQPRRDRGGHRPRVFRLFTGCWRAARTGYDPLFACPGMVEDDYYRFVRSRPTDPGSSTTSGQPFAKEAC
jgi:hypothetical protein